MAKKEVKKKRMSKRLKVSSTKTVKREKKSPPPPFDDSKHSTDSLTELIKLGNAWKVYNRKYETSRKRKRCEDYDRLTEIIGDLQELEELIGMKDVKNNVVNQILFFIQDLNNDEMMHTVIMSPPGSGKTTLGRILGNVYRKLGFLTKGHFKIAGRPDFIGEYLGQTAIKTKKLLNSCRGGVLFIDEAYSLGNPEGRDSYAKEAIDTLNQFLSENTSNFVCIIAGYEKELEKCFFKGNPGLERRFPWKYKIQSYSPKELAQIFQYQANQCGWLISYPFSKIVELFEKEKSLFKHSGGDTLILFDKCKVTHAKRVFGKEAKDKGIITEEDITHGIELLRKAKEKKNLDRPPPGLYM